MRGRGDGDDNDAEMQLFAWTAEKSRRAVAAEGAAEWSSLATARARVRPVQLPSGRCRAVRT